MNVKSHLSAGFGACALGLLATTVQAAPLSGLADAVDREATRNSAVETVTWGHRRHCYWHYGHRHCWYGHRHYRGHYRYGHHYGYRRWW